MSSVAWWKSARGGVVGAAAILAAGGVTWLVRTGRAPLPEPAEAPPRIGELRTRATK